MNKAKYMWLGLGSSLLSGAAMAAEGDIDLTAITTAAPKIQTALTSFFNDTIAPLVVAVGGVALAVYLVTVLFRWARRLGR